MAEQKTNPWLIGAVAIGAAIVLYLLYQEAQTAAANAASTAQQNASYATATGSANGIVQSLIPDQLGTTSPATVTSSTGTSSAPVPSEATTETGAALATGGVALPTLPTV